MKPLASPYPCQPAMTPSENSFNPYSHLRLHFPGLLPCLVTLMLLPSCLLLARPPKEEITPEQLGYTIIYPEDPYGDIRVMREDTLVWQTNRWMVFTGDTIADKTGNGLPNMLIYYAHRRSFRGYMLIEFAPERINEQWNIVVHASESEDIERDIYERLKAGISLEHPPSRSRGIDPDIHF